MYRIKAQYKKVINVNNKNFKVYENPLDPTNFILKIKGNVIVINMFYYL